MAKSSHVVFRGGIIFGWVNFHFKIVPGRYFQQYFIQQDRMLLQKFDLGHFSEGLISATPLPSPAVPDAIALKVKLIGFC